MRHIADIWVIDAIAGAEAAYPIFDDTEYSKLNNYLAIDAKRRFQEHVNIVRQTKSELKDLPTVAARVSSSSSCGLESLAPEWVSLLCIYESYSGGAHGGFSFKSVNYSLDDNGNVQLFRLWDMLIKSASNIDKLSKMIISELKHQEASSVLDGSFTVNDLVKEIKKDQINVTVLPSGLAFHFDPYHVGYGAQGFFRAVIPNHKIESMFRKDGPLHERSN